MPNPGDIVLKIIETVECPKCGEPKGQPCRKPNLSKLRGVHVDRSHKYIAILVANAAKP